MSDAVFEEENCLHQRRPNQLTPRDDDAEARVLAGILISEPDDARKLFLQLSSVDFCDIRCQVVYHALSLVEMDGERLNTESLYKRLKETGSLANAGGFSFVTALSDKIIGPSFAEQSLLDALELSARRKAVVECQDTIRRAQNLSQPFERKVKSSLPGVDNGADLVADETVTLPPEIIENILHQGLKGVLGSSSKARKTWLLIDAAVSVAAGVDFWKWRTRKGRVIYLNFEIPRPFIRSRIKRVCEEKGVTDIRNLDVWTLRGHAAALGKLLPSLMAKIEAGKYSLVIIDPIYKGLGGRDENKAGDISELCNELEKIAVESGAAVLYAAHFSKGNQAGKEAIDRIGGSGVWTRDADTIITLTKHKVEGAFTVDLILRNLPEHPPFVVEWEFPLMKHAAHLDTEDLKPAKGGRKKLHTAEKLLETLAAGGLKNKAWMKAADNKHGIKERTFYELRNELELAGRVFESKVNSKWQPIKKK